MIQKQNYEAPEATIIEMALEDRFLQNTNLTTDGSGFGEKAYMNDQSNSSNWNFGN